MSAPCRVLVLAALLAALGGAACSSDGDSRAESDGVDLGPTMSGAPTTTATQTNGPTATTDSPTTETDGDGGGASATNEVSVGPAFAGQAVIGFGTQAVGEEGPPVTLTVRSRQQNPLAVTGVSVVGDHPADFVATTACDPEDQLERDETCEVTVRFRPTEAGERRGVLEIVVTGGFGRQVRLTGQGSE